MKEMIGYHSDTDLERILSTVNIYVTNRVVKNLRVFVKRGKLKLELPEADFDDNRWDGTLLIHFVEPMSAADVVNYIVNESHANEMSFDDDKTLRLWWD